MRKPGRSGRALTAAGLPADSDCRMPVVTITGGRYLKAEHHMGVLLLTENCVRLYSRMGIIRIEGRRLAASDMDGDVILLEGEVRSVSFEK
ncbi:MAG: YabP/YqfC family sporulation protein [Clostridiales bacterium]|nr:YabP/YqfC family sporulation protein [Clostridiales bacterium]